jgi:hypothetical protein
MVLDGGIFTSILYCKNIILYPSNRFALTGLSQAANGIIKSEMIAANSGVCFVLWPDGLIHGGNVRATLRNWLFALYGRLWPFP